MNNYIFLNKYSITEKELSDINNFLIKCSETDKYLYDFQYEEELLNIPSFYFCYENNIIIGILSVCLDELDTLCIYSIVSPKYRKKHIFSSLFKMLSDNIKSFNHTYKYLDFHLSDNNSDFFIPAKNFLTENNFMFSHKEYLLSFSLSDNLDKKIVLKKIPSNKSDLELLFDNSSNEFTLWIDENYIGECMIYFPEESAKSYATIYDYEIQEVYRGMGYGKFGLYLILKELQNMQLQKAILHVSGLNKKAHSLYISCGFQINSSITVFTKEI